MAFAYSRYSAEPGRAQVSRRAVALTLAILIHALLIVILLRQTFTPMRRSGTDSMAVTFHLLPAPQARADSAPKPAAAEAARQRAVRPVQRPEVDLTRAKIIPRDGPPNFLVLTREDFVAADIGRMPKQPPASGNGGTTGTGSDSAASGDRGPNGERLYSADWYRRPTHAELSAYIPANAPPAGWGLIACRTVAQYRVEDCQELGESPRGSGLARAVRQAAWQFRVLPPRIGGRLVVGEWVKIRIDYTEREIR